MLDRRLGGLRFLDQSDDLGEGGVGADIANLDLESTPPATILKRP